MSTKFPRDIDERARKTRNRIARAVTDLGLNRPLETITVRQLAAAAGISRSTFYAHYSSLEDYLTQSYAWMLERGARISAARPRGDEKPLPVRAILDHIAERRQYAAATKDSRLRPAMMAAGEERLRAFASANLDRMRADLPKAERVLLATFIAGGFMAILKSWIAEGMADAPEVIEDRFERLCATLLRVNRQAD